MAASVDGSKIVAATTDVSGPQNVAIYDAASNKWLTNSALENFGGNAALSANGAVIESGRAPAELKRQRRGLVSLAGRLPISRAVFLPVFGEDS